MARNKRILAMNVEVLRKKMIARTKLLATISVKEGDNDESRYRSYSPPKIVGMGRSRKGVKGRRLK